MSEDRALAERAAIVAWLKRESDDAECGPPFIAALRYAASAIERGEHERAGCAAPDDGAGQ